MILSYKDFENLSLVKDGYLVCKKPYGYIFRIEMYARHITPDFRVLQKKGFFYTIEDYTKPTKPIKAEATDIDDALLKINKFIGGIINV